MRTSITLSAAEAKILLGTGRVTVLHPLSPQPTQGLRPYVDAATNEQVWGYEVGSMPKSAGVIEYSDGTFRSVSPPQVRTWRCPWGSPGAPLAVREPWAELCRAADDLCWCSEEERQRNHYAEYRADTPDAKRPGGWDALSADECDEDTPRWRSGATMPGRWVRMRVKVGGVEARRDARGVWRWHLCLRLECPQEHTGAKSDASNASVLSGCSWAAGGRQDVKNEETTPCSE